MRLCGAIWYFILLFCIAIPSQAVAERRVALVIGNSSYEHAGELPNPRNDAADISAQLKKLGFEIIDGIDLNKNMMDKKIRDFAKALTGADAGVFFYAGHGLQVNGVNYLVPVDAELSTAAALDWEMVRLDLVQRTMEREAKTNILFLDACRDNPLARNLARAMGTRSTEIGRGLAAAESGVGTLISYSTQPGNVALDGKGRNSPFAAALAKNVGTSREDLSALLISVRRDVMKATENKQVPWEHSALTGQFYFASREAAAPSAPDAVPAPNSQDVGRVWESIQNSTSAGVLEGFRKQFGTSNPFYDSLAASRIAELNAAADAKKKADEDAKTAAAAQAAAQAAASAKQKQAAIADKLRLIRDLQRELTRVGCDPESSDGTWGSKSKIALADFSRFSKISLAIDEPTAAALNAVTGQKGRVCPLHCDKGQIESNGRCIAEPKPEPPKAMQRSVRNSNEPERRQAVTNPSPPPASDHKFDYCSNNNIARPDGVMGETGCHEKIR